MTRFTRAMSLGAAVIMLASAAWAQYLSEVVGFNDNPDVPDSHEMFKIPEWSGSTAGYILANDPNNPYGNDNAWRKTGFDTEPGSGGAAMNVYFNWVDPSDSRAWVRVTTFNGPERPNPSLHLQGKVRFKITNVSELFNGDIGICIGVRETGVNVPQLADGGTTGDIEWIGASGIIPDPNDPNGTPTPIPVFTLVTSSSAVQLEFDLATGEVRRNGVLQGSGIVGFTGDGVLSAPNNRGTLEHIAIVNLSGDPATLIDVHIDELQFEAPVPDPVVPPRVVEPIILGDTAVTVTDLLATVDQVSLYRDGGLVETKNVTDPNDAVFDISASPAVTGEVFTATQRDSVTGITSDQSDGVTVLPEASPYGISFVLDEDGNDCDFNPPGGWEFVGAPSKLGLPGGYLYPDGALLFNDSSQWQIIDIPLDDPNVVTAWLGGDGDVDPSPTGLYQTDTIWFNSPPGGSAGPHEIFLDSIQVLDANDVVLETIHEFEDGLNYMTAVRGQSNTNLTSSSLSTATSYNGFASQRLTWSYDPNEPNAAIGILTRLGSCGTNPQFTDAGSTVRFHFLARSAADPNLPAIPEVVGPIVGNQTSVRVVNDAAATAVQLYIDGVAHGSPVTPTGTETDFTGLTLVVGDSISAKQTIGGAESDFAYPRVVSAEPSAPVVSSPIAPGSTSVTVTGVYSTQFASASLVTAYVNGAPQGTAVPTGDTVSVPLGVTLATGDLVTATQTVNGATSAESDAVTVAFTAPVIYAAPAEGDTTVTVMGMETNADSATVVVNGATEFTQAAIPGLDRLDVTVSGLVAGDSIVAYYTVGGIDSVASDYEIVTVAATTPVFPCEDFETFADQAAMELVWTQGGTVPVELATDKDATCTGGLQSCKTPPGNSWMYQEFPLTVPTETDPVVFNVNIYDPMGPDPSGTILQWAEINAQGGGPDYFFIHIGMLGWADTDNIHYDLRALGNGGPNWVDLDQYDAPLRSIGWHTFTLIHKGNRIDVYVDGLLSLKNLQLSAETTYSEADIGGGNWGNGADVWFDDLCVETGAPRFGCIGSQPPAAPVISAPIQDGDETVTVTGVQADVTLLQILDGATVIGSAAGPFDPNGVASVSVAPPLVHLHSLTAEATNAVGTTASDPLEVGNGNGDLLVCIGVRETGDTGPLGSEGGTTGEIEWVGASSAVNGAPQGVSVPVSDSWQTLTFDPLVDPITGFTGDGVITETRGTLEHLAVAVDAASPDRSTGRYDVYIDNVINVGADGGADFLIEDFEGYIDGDEVLFQEPTNSGSTAGDLTPLPSASEISSDEGNPGSSEWLVWFFKDTTDQRWARITTSGVANTSRPIIDLTKPIKLDILLGTGAAVDGDIDGDGDVDLADLGLLLAAYGECVGDPNYNPAADFDSSGCIDLFDLGVLLGNYGFGT